MSLGKPCITFSYQLSTQATQDFVPAILSKRNHTIFSAENQPRFKFRHESIFIPSSQFDLFKAIPKEKRFIHSSDEKKSDQVQQKDMQKNHLESGDRTKRKVRTHKIFNQYAAKIHQVQLQQSQVRRVDADNARSILFNSNEINERPFSSNIFTSKQTKNYQKFVYDLDRHEDFSQSKRRQLKMQTQPVCIIEGESNIAKDKKAKFNDFFEEEKSDRMLRIQIPATKSHFYEKTKRNHELNCRNVHHLNPISNKMKKLERNHKRYSHLLSGWSKQVKSKGWQKQAKSKDKRRQKESKKWDGAKQKESFHERLNSLQNSCMKSLIGARKDEDQNDGRFFDPQERANNKQASYKMIELSSSKHEPEAVPEEDHVLFKPSVSFEPAHEELTPFLHRQAHMNQILEEQDQKEITKQAKEEKREGEGKENVLSALRKMKLRLEVVLVLLSIIVFTVQVLT